MNYTPEKEAELREELKLWPDGALLKLKQVMAMYMPPKKEIINLVKQEIERRQALTRPGFTPGNVLESEMN